MSQFRDFSAFGSAQVVDKRAERGERTERGDRRDRRYDRDMYIERERAEKRRAEDAARAKEASLVLNDVNYPAIGDGGAWGPAKPAVSMNFAKMASEWQTKDEEDKKNKELQAERARIELIAQERRDRERQVKIDRDREISELFERRQFGIDHSCEEDTYTEEPYPVKDGWETVSRPEPRKPKMRSFVPTDDDVEEEKVDETVWDQEPVDKHSIW